MRRHRHRLALSQEDLATRTGVHTRTIAKIEAGHVTAPRASTLRLLADGLGLAGVEREAFLLGLADADAESAPDRPRPARDRSSGPGRDVRPAQLPHDATDFTGRSVELRILDTLLLSPGSGDARLPADPGPSGAGGAAFDADPASQAAGQVANRRLPLSAVTGGRLVVVDGGPGTGKTALVDHWAHRACHEFPDGQLYVSLRANTPGSTVTTLQALSSLLTGLGAPAADRPLTVDAAAAAYRTTVADRRILVILDDVENAAQARALLPGGPHARTLVTSRVRLDGLIARDGARRISLAGLDPAESVDLLRRTLHDHGRRASDDNLAELAGLCAHLPLALRIAAAHIVGDAHRTVEAYIADLRRGDRLAALAVPGDPDTAIRVAFDMSHASLTAEGRAVFRLFGLVPGPDVTVDGLAALGATTAGQITAPLYELVRAHLVEERSPGRYTPHDLLRIYAAEKVRADAPPAGESAAVRRLVDLYVATATAAATTAFPHATRCTAPAGVAGPTFADAHAAMAWCEAERANFLPVARAARRHGAAEAVWRLADALREWYVIRRHDLDWLTLGEDAVDAAADDTGIAAAALNLGVAYRNVGRHGDAITHLTAAAVASRRVGWWDAETAALIMLGWTEGDTGRLESGIGHLRTALRTAEVHCSPVVEARARNALAVLRRLNGDIRDTPTEFAAVLATMVDTGSVAGQAAAHTNLAISYYQLGQLDLARRHAATGMAGYRATGDRYGTTLVLMVMAEIHGRRSRHRLAADLAAAGLRMSRDLGDRLSQAMALTISADIDRHRGNVSSTLAAYTEALALARAASATEWQVQALIGLGAVALDRSLVDEARTHLDEALGIARDCGYKVHECLAMAVMADLHTRAGDPASAARCAAEAAGLQRRTGHRLDP